jgi:hypothetical protein
MKFSTVDIGKQKCFFAMINSEGKFSAEFAIQNNKEEIEGLISKLCMDDRVFVESRSSIWSNLYDRVERGHIRVVLANPLHTKVITSAKIKSDKMDARILAHPLRADLIPPCVVPPCEFGGMRGLLRHRVSLVTVRPQVKNQVHSLLNKNARASKDKPCLVSCSALKAEIRELLKRGELNADLVFVSNFFHGDYALLEKNLRSVLKRTLSRSSGRIILVYGDLCLGPNNEMKKLAEEYGVIKVDGVTCIDCLLGGKGKFFEADPTHKLLLLAPGMIGFYKYLKNKARQEGIDEDAFRQFFSGLKGIMFLDTLGEAEKNLEEIDKLNFGLPVLETKRIGSDDLKLVILEAIERSNQTSAC